MVHKTEATLLINQLYIMIPILRVLKVIGLHISKHQIRLLIICFLGRWCQIAEYFSSFPTMMSSSLCRHVTLGKGHRKGDHFQSDSASFTVSCVLISVCFFLEQHSFIKVTDNISDVFLFISPSCFSFLSFLASSSFKNHFTLGKTRRHMPVWLSVCAEWLGISGHLPRSHHRVKLFSRGALFYVFMAPWCHMLQLGSIFFSVHQVFPHFKAQI